ncbi:MAG: lysophospholipid acyltransferase family protein [bacterium]|nr:lysophospholipid acyltransferase family protein [bacterium]
MWVDRSINLILLKIRFLFAYLIFVVGTFTFSRLVLVPLMFFGTTVLTRRVVASKTVRFYLNILQFLGLFKITTKGCPPSGRCIVIYNHPTMFDALIPIAQIPNSCCVAKRQLTHSIVYGVGLRSLNFIVAQSAQEILEKGKHELHNGNPVVIFPEGTRGPLSKFHRSAARLALEANVPVVAGLIVCRPLILGRTSKWYQTPDRLIEIDIEYFQPVWSMEKGQALGKLSRTLTAELEDMFASKLNELNMEAR